MNFSVRKADEMDKFLIKQYKKEILLYDNNKFTDEEVKRIKRYIEEDTENNYRQYTMIETRSEIIGIYKLIARETDYFLDTLYIKKEYRNMNVGTKLLKHLTEEASERGKDIYLQTYNTNFRAVKFYTRLNFKVVDEKEDKYIMKYGD